LARGNSRCRDLRAMHSGVERWLCFFFQAEDGIRDWSVTGVQTCALPISDTSSPLTWKAPCHPGPAMSSNARSWSSDPASEEKQRSEERRVGKEWRYRWSRYHYKRKDEGGGVEEGIESSKRGGGGAQSANK